MNRDPLSVFLNVPFDKQCEGLFEALIFTITACGYRVRCALEEDDSGDIRMDKLDRLIRSSPRSIHDLSRTKVEENELPRFNMPFELGLAIGAKRFGRQQRNDSIKIMVAERYRLPAYLSDLGGNDPAAHDNESANVVRIVRDFLHTDPTGAILPGPRHFVSAFEAFKGALPGIARGIDHQPDEINSLISYRQFIWCVAEFLKTRADS